MTTNSQVMQQIQNPYLDEFLKLDLSQLEPLSDTEQEMKKRYACAVPTQEALEAIAEYSPILERGAGGGYWAWCLEQLGVTVDAYDIFSSAHAFINPYCEMARTWTNISDSRDPQIYIEDWEQFSLMLCCPLTHNNMAYTILESYLQIGGQQLIYIGEPEGGHDADEYFFRLLYGYGKHPPEMELVTKMPLPCWPGSNDSLFIYQRLPND